MKDYMIIISVILIFCLFIIALLFLFVIKEEKKSYCGDKICEMGETYENCPKDCKSTKIEQGVKGTITLYQGNCVPPAGPSCITNKLSTTIKIYNLISNEDIVEKYYEGSLEPIATVLSNEDGYFEIGLPNGQYSIFAEDPINENKDYCNTFDANYSCPITIDNNLLEFNIKIDHASW